MSADISVVIPAYNCQRYICETIESVLNQSRVVREIIVVDDGSVDDTAKAVSRFGDSISLIRQSNSGVSTARNVGMLAAKGEWIAFLDADDLWEPHKVELFWQQSQFHRDAKLIFSDYREFGTQRREVRLAETFSRIDFANELLSPSVCVLPSASMVSANVKARFPIWAGNDNEDTIFFNDVADEGIVVHIPELLTCYRQHPTSAQSQQGTGERAGLNMKRRYMGDDERRRRFLNTLFTLIKQRRESRRWEEMERYCQYVREEWPDDKVASQFLRRIQMTRPLYQLKDGLDAIRSMVLGRSTS